MEKIILETEYAVISHDVSLKLGKIVWKRKTSVEEYKHSFITLFDFAKNNTTYFFLSDIRNQSVVSPEGRKWFETDLLPKAIKMGLKKAVSISDDNVFKKYYLNILIKSSKKFGLPLKLFSNEEDAIKWFKE